MDDLERYRRWSAAVADTPVLVVDRERVERNIASMAAYAATQGIALRPHAKTHKSPAVAALQRSAGAVGHSVATVGEAEVFAAHGAADLFVAYPLWAGGDLGPRLTALAEQARLCVGVDSAAGARRLREAVGRNVAIDTLVEVDCGLRRTGTASSDAGAVAVAARDAGFGVRGVFTFPGHSYAPGAAQGAIADEERALGEASAAVKSEGLECPVRSGGSTPTAHKTPSGTVNELRPGVYVFNDAQQVALGTCEIGDVALAAVATVVSAPVPDRVVLDAGSKVLGPERPPWTPGHGLIPAHPGAVVTGLWEHHAVVDVSSLPVRDRPKLGDRVAVVPNHVCTAVNLARTVCVIEGSRVTERWEIAARGQNR